jgi:arsenate reductase (thioredoxin)
MYILDVEHSILRVLFLCVHNSARSQMAAAYLKAMAGGRFEAESAGLEPGKLNPYVVRAMSEDGIDISGNKAQSVFDLAGAGKRFDYVITVCSKEAAEACPIFPGGSEKLHWPFPDPSTFKGSDGEIMEKVREVRDAIRTAVEEFARTH